MITHRPDTCMINEKELDEPLLEPDGRVAKEDGPVTRERTKQFHGRTYQVRSRPFHQVGFGRAHLIGVRQTHQVGLGRAGYLDELNELNKEGT